jgi:hypothetical protein
VSHPLDEVPPANAARRDVLGFSSVRLLAQDTFERIAERIGAALSCPLLVYEERGAIAAQGRVLGMTIELSLWPTASDPLLLLKGYAGYASWASVEDSFQVDISGAIIALLLEAGLGEWRVPTQADLEAAEQAQDRIDKAFAGPGQRD